MDTRLTDLQCMLYKDTLYSMYKSQAAPFHVDVLCLNLQRPMVLGNVNPIMSSLTISFPLHKMQCP
jgi:hypothetical protein